MITMLAPPHRSGRQRLIVNEEQAKILRAIGWTEEDPPKAQEISPEPVQNEQNFFRAPQKRKYTRRDMKDEKPKRRYRRRDMVPEDDE